MTQPLFLAGRPFSGRGIDPFSNVPFPDDSVPCLWRRARHRPRESPGQWPSTWPQLSAQDRQNQSFHESAGVFLPLASASSPGLLGARCERRYCKHSVGALAFRAVAAAQRIPASYYWVGKKVRTGGPSTVQNTERGCRCCARRAKTTSRWEVLRCYERAATATAQLF